MKKVLYTANTFRHLLLCHRPYIKYLSSNFIVDTACNDNEYLGGVRKYYNVLIERKPFKINNIKSIFVMKKIIEEEKYDLIHVNTPMGAAVTRLALIKYKKNNDVKVIYTAHGFHFFKGAPLINYLLYYPIEKILSKYTDVIITMNEEDYNFAKKHFKTRIEYIPGIGFDKSKFSEKIDTNKLNRIKKENNISDNDYVISYVAEISNRKRQVYLIKTLKKYKFTNEKILLIGDISNSKRIIKYIKKYKLENYIRLIDFNDDILYYLTMSNLVLSVSKQEGLPLNIMEAMYLEKPIIVTNCRGNRDLITNNKNGLVISLNSKKELIDSIMYIKNNPKVGEKLGKRNKKIINKYSIDNVLDIMKRIYNSL